MSTRPAPPRLHFCFAREAPVGIILSRGPSAWVRLIRWRLDSDTFEPGQWLRARVRAESLALSPSGEYLLYEAFNYRRRQTEQGFYRWLAVSRPPYWTALALWPFNGPATAWGYFESNRVLRLGHDLLGLAPKVREGDVLPRWLRVLAPPLVGGEDPRGGWTQQHWGDRGATARERRAKPWIKHGPRGHVLVMRTRRDQRRYELCAADATILWPIGEADHADWDPRGRLIVAREGRLHAARWFSTDIYQLEQIADFTGAVPQPIESPEWARRWR